MAVDNTTLRADPRIQALRRQSGQGNLTAEQLRQMGFDVPDGYHYVWGGRAGYGTLMDNKRSFVEKAVPIAAIGMGTVAGLGAAGVIPGFGAASTPAAAAAGAPGYVPQSMIGRNVPTGITPPPGGAGGGGVPNAAGQIARTVAGAADGKADYLSAAIAALAGLPGVLGNKGQSDEERALMEQARQMQELQANRIRSQNPLFDAVTKLAMQRLPTNVQG